MRYNSFHLYSTWFLYAFDFSFTISIRIIICELEITTIPFNLPTDGQYSETLARHLSSSAYSQRLGNSTCTQHHTSTHHTNNLSATQLASCQHDAGFDVVTKSSCQPPPGCYQYLCSKRRILHVTIGVQIKETRPHISLITTTIQLLLTTSSPVVSCSNPSTALVISILSSNVLQLNNSLSL